MKVNAAILGSGNIGTDLLYKALRSRWITPVWLVGIDPASEGLRRAQTLGVKTTSAGVDGLLPTLRAEGVKIVFDATSAHTHVENARRLEGEDVILIDLTPAALGPYCVPPVNLVAHVGTRARNLNMVTCGGQATIPVVAAVSRVQPVAYAEIVATVASRSVGPGTRQNIDEFTRTTRAAVAAIGGAKDAKAIVIINPAEPPLIMRDTIHCLTEDPPDQGAIAASVGRMVKEVQRYVPGFHVKNGPVFDGRRVSVYVEVKGLGDFLPEYAGNLDIMTAAALRTAEMLAEERRP